MSSYSEFRQLNYCNIARERAYLLYIHRSKFNRVWQILTRELKRYIGGFESHYMRFTEANAYFSLVKIILFYKAHTLILPTLFDCFG